MINFLNISYLKLGNEKQQKAYQVITDHAVLEKLAQYSPILVGTIPINIDIEKSDLDIICHAQDREEFRKKLEHYFRSMKGFIISENQKLHSLKANFFINDFEFEIFGQNIPTELQNAYCHMLVEHKILQEAGEDFRTRIIELKRQGYKTEPAFAKLLALKGDAYESLLKLKI
ncbi:DUF4269 domain-containing protein [Pedobacter sp. MC2016-05]|uniref:DUF4269 domain-containing protein n=1 Tax=Pedobacter sp. MC2016-05 TaxID=2994474 RepID=UPI002246EAB9|nr:DUF4269 domain-containing protein [Pedobacter sp. MC2016-05]MCX2477142.1 DUF4269 domain-containing protein [Pedobacter sp. MC2016-05]